MGSSMYGSNMYRTRVDRQRDPRPGYNVENLFVTGIYNTI